MDQAQTRPPSDVAPQEIQALGVLAPRALGLSENTRASSVAALNLMLADTMTLRDLYKKHHWQVAGPTFIQLHELFDKHHGEQADLVDEVAERIMTLGGVSLAMGAEVAAATRLPAPPSGVEAPRAQIMRLLEAHERILIAARAEAQQAAARGDDATADLMVSGVIKTGEAQAWFLGAHLVHLPD